MDTPSKGERDLSDYCCKVCGERLEREDRGRATRFYCPKCGCYRRGRGMTIPQWAPRQVTHS